MTPITEHVVRTDRHRDVLPRLRARRRAGDRVRARLAGAVDQLAAPAAGFGALGFRAVAPDMRGYGRSSRVRAPRGLCAASRSSRDMIELLDALGRERAVWVGPRLGQPGRVEPRQPPPRALPRRGESVRAVLSRSSVRVRTASIPLVDRDGLSRGPVPGRAVGLPALLPGELRRAHARASRPTSPTSSRRCSARATRRGKGKPSRTAMVRRRRRLVRRRRPGAGPAARRRRASARRTSARYAAALEPQRLLRPGLLVHEPRRQRRLCRARGERRPSRPAGAVPRTAQYDYTCETIDVAAGRADARGLPATSPRWSSTSGHWMAQEKPRRRSTPRSRKWLAARFPQLWPA